MGGRTNDGHLVTYNKLGDQLAEINSETGYQLSLPEIIYIYNIRITCPLPNIAMHLCETHTVASF